MSDEIVDNLKTPSEWLRVLYMAGFVVALYVTGVVLLVLMLAQIMFSLITGTDNTNLRRLGASLSDYVAQILGFLTYNSELRPFPFTPFPITVPETPEAQDPAPAAPKAPAAKDPAPVAPKAPAAQDPAQPDPKKAPAAKEQAQAAPKTTPTKRAAPRKSTAQKKTTTPKKPAAAKTAASKTPKKSTATQTKKETDA